MDQSRGYLQAMITSRDFLRLFGRPLEAAGYVRKGKAWYFRGKEIIFLIDLQKSDWSNSYHINLSFWILRLGEADFPKENHCHIQIRALSFFPDVREELDKACDLDEGGITEVDRQNFITNFVETRLLELGRMATLDGLKQLYQGGALSRALLFKEAKELLAAQ
jgi:hypothetical protein